MPTLTWIGKDKVVNHHHDVPYSVLEKIETFTASNQQSAISNQQSAISNQQSAISNQQSAHNTQNRIIHGDNLAVLKSLLPEFEGRINCIYIDPPYNTGNENWVYNDNVNDPRIKKWLGDVVGKECDDLTRHDKWLCMMYPRLKLLHRLLADDGVIFISIDDEEHANLKLIMDEVWGAANFISNVIWQKKYSPQNDAKHLSSMHDFIMVYAKNKNIWRPNLLIRSNESLARYKNPDNDRRGNWKVGDLTSKTKAAGHSYPITSPSGKIFYPSSGRQWAPALSTFEKLLADNRIWFGKTGDNVPSLKQFLTEVQSGTVPLTIWLRDEVGDNQEAVQTLKGIFDGNANSFETPKPPRLIERILQIATNKNSIILDSFAGSGTTAHAVLKLNAQDGGNRQFILCEMMDYANTITAERVRRVMTGYGEGTKKVEGLGGAFDYYELGQPLFIGEYLNEIVGESKIRQYIAYSENIPPEQRTHQSAVSPYLLGINTATAWIFYYDAQRETILTVDFLATLNYRTNGYTVPAHSIIYADRCVLTTAQLQRYGIQFKKTPRDITRL